MKYSDISDLDLLKKLLGARESVKVYSGSLRPLFDCSDGAKPHEKLLVARELVKRWLNEQLKQQCMLSSPAEVREYFRIFFADKEHESFVVLFLDSQNRLIKSEEIYRGTLTQTSVYPREIVKAALRHNAGAVIFAHNHPSGVAEPSHADETLTQNLKQALALVDVKVLDHFVIAGTDILSFVVRGLL